MNVKELFSFWITTRQHLLEALDKVTDDQLTFVPHDGLRSLGQVARHIAHAEEGWFRYAIARAYDEWPPDYTAEDYPTVAAIKTLLTDVHARTLAYLATLSVDNLAQPIETPWGEIFSLKRIIWIVYSHEQLHRGEIYLMLGLLGIDAPQL